MNAPKNTWERTISSGSVGSQQSPSAARNRGSSLPSDTPKSCSTPTAGSPLHRSVPRQNKKGMHISYKWPNSQAKKPKNITETRKSSSSTFIAAIQRFNNATKGLLTLKGVWGGRGKCWVFFSEHKAIATSSALLHLHGTERSKFSTGLMAKPNQKTADTPLE